MNKLLSILALMICGDLHTLSAQTKSQDLARADLDQYFQRISLASDHFTFVRKPSGPRFSVRIGSNDVKLSEPGTSIDVPFGTPFELFERHSGIKFEPLSGNLRSVGVRATKYFDARSFGKGVQSSKGIVLVVKDKTNPGENCLVIITKDDIAEATRALGTH